MVTTEGDEVVVAFLLVSVKASGHRGIVGVGGLSLEQDYGWVDCRWGSVEPTLAMKPPKVGHTHSTVK